MSNPYRCSNERRRLAVLNARDEQNQPILNGLDFLEVDANNQKILRVYFLHPLPGQNNGVPADPYLVPSRQMIAIEGGVRVTNVRIVNAVVAGKVLTLTVDAPGDFSTYTLRLVTSPTNKQTPSGFDPPLAAIDFSFKIDCPSDFDCAPAPSSPPPAASGPLIDYLAKDYASFRRLMLDRLAVMMPEWQERNPADLGVMLVEVLAFAADQLSYYQDAVATEAYLATARRRTSVRRHARLLDYPMHDGANARTWVTLEVEQAGDGVTLFRGQRNNPEMPRFLTRCGEGTSSIIRPSEWQVLVAEQQPEIFEPLHDVTVFAAHNAIPFYTWSDEDCMLPKGSTRATLLDDPHQRLRLCVGDVVIIEEGRDPLTGEANQTHRQAVRLTQVTPAATRTLHGEQEVRTPGSILRDPLTQQAIVEIAWHPEDALPFCLRIPTSQGSLTDSTQSLVRGNVVLVDHGRTLPAEPLAPLPTSGRYRPVLQRGPITQQGLVRNTSNELLLFDPAGSAQSVLRWDSRDTRPAVELIEAGSEDRPWVPLRDLLGSSRFAREFVVEVEENGRANLRFGDGVSGSEPLPGLQAIYRVGQGKVGNVGAEAIAHIVTKLPITRVRNPLPARGGTDPEPLEQVRLYAPQAFRSQERAITEDDYAAAAQRYPEVQTAAATRRWTGSWYTMFITIDRKNGLPVDEPFKQALRAHVERFRLAGYDIEIEAPRLVPLDIVLSVSVDRGYFPANVRQALRDVFSNSDLPNGQRGFFHPDNLTFGQPVYLSQIIAAAMQVPGVNWVTVDRFQRWGAEARDELETGRVQLGRLEIARLDNDPNAPEGGKIEFVMQGGS